MFRQTQIRKLQKWHYLSVCTALFYVNSCISPVDIDSDVERDILIVDGIITNKPGPYEIRLSRIAKFAGTLDGGTIKPVEGAQVFITDQTGEQIMLSEIEVEGNPQVIFSCFRNIVNFPIDTVVLTRKAYLTPPEFRGKVGSTYTLNLRTLEGENYSSSPQTITKGPPIDSLEVLFKRLPSSDPITFPTGVEVLVHFNDPPDEQNFYLWTITSGTYEIFTRPDLFSGNGCDSEHGEDLRPKNCCRQCWVEENLTSVEVTSDALQNGNHITNSVAFIEDDGFRFQVRYHVQVNQYHVPREAFEFHRLVSSQLDIEGSIFDPPPSTIIGNIRSIDNSELFAIGYFGAFHIQESTAFIQPSILEIKKRKLEWRDDCRNLRGASTEKPVFWDN